MRAQATLVVIKPDTIRRGIVGAVFTKLEELQLEIIGAKAVRVSRALAEEHYAALRGKPFFEELLRHLRGELHGVGYVLALVLYGPDAIGRVREAVGATHPEHAVATSIRGAFGRMTASGIMENVVHASSTVVEAKREIRLWFSPKELLTDPFGAIPEGKASRRRRA